MAPSPVRKRLRDLNVASGGSNISDSSKQARARDQDANEVTSPSSPVEKAAEAASKVEDAVKLDVDHESLAELFSVPPISYSPATNEYLASTVTSEAASAFARSADAAVDAACDGAFSSGWSRCDEIENGWPQHAGVSDPSSERRNSLRTNAPDLWRTRAPSPCVSVCSITRGLSVQNDPNLKRSR